MPKPPIPQMNKGEILNLYRWKCKHGHNGLEHYGCFLTEEEGKPERVGFFDIESTNLTASFGIVFCYCLKEEYSDKIHHACLTRADLKDDTFDRRVMEQLVRDLYRFQRIVTHYGERFDIPFCRSRCLQLGIDFPHYGELVQTDVWALAKRKLKIHSNRQEAVSEFLHGDSMKTKITPQVWIKALTGDKPSLDYILDHCKRDVIDLEANYHKLVPYSRKARTSI